MSVLSSKEGCPHDPDATTALVAGVLEAAAAQGPGAVTPRGSLVLSHWLALLQPHGVAPCVSTSKFPSSCRDSSPIGFRAHEQNKGPFSFPFRPVSQQWLTRKLAGCPGHAVCGLLPPWLQRRARKGRSGQRVSGGTPSHGTVGMETVSSAQD